MSTMVAASAAVAVFALGVGAVAGGVTWTTPNKTQATSQRTTITNTPTPTRTTPTKAPPAPLTYDQVRDQLIGVLNQSGPAIALTDLDQITQRYPYVARFCHPIAHDLGHAALTKFGGDFQKAISFRNDVCGSGYLHGVVEQALTNSPKPKTALMTLCKPTDYSCMHGIGHGAMFVTDMNLPAAEDLCDTLPSADRSSCGEGVFMQNFETDLTEVHQSTWLRPNDPMYPCSSQRSPYDGDCFYYAPQYYLSLHPDQYSPGLSWCTTAPTQDNAWTCTMGLGSRIMKYNIDRETYSEAQCRAGKTWQRQPCINGMVSYYQVNYHSASAGTRLCAKLRYSDDVAYCKAAAGTSSSKD